MTVKNSLILAKMSKPLHRGQFFGLFSNGGELNIDGKFGVRISKIDKDYYTVKLIHYGEVPTYRVDKAVKVIREKVEVSKENEGEFEMNVVEGGDMIDDL